MKRKSTVGGGYPLQNKRKLVGFLTLLLVLIVGIFFSYSRATLKKQESVADATLKVGTLEYTTNMAGLITQERSFTISAHDYSFIGIDITSKNSINSKYSLIYSITSPNNLADSSYEVAYFEHRDIPTGMIKPSEQKNIYIRIQNKGSSNITVRFQLKSGLVNNEIELLSGEKQITKVVDSNYQEYVLNGTDPVLTSNLVPVYIDGEGTVRKANVYEEWYRYGEKRWANAVILFDKSISYSDMQVIPESNIQSYFVWIPRYKYQIFNTGNYTSLTSLSSTAVQTINVVFENKNTAVSNGSSVNAWLTHPAFTTFNSNGFWVGKFESGYKGATSKAGAEQNNNNYANLIIKPNVYSWRGITVGNMFKVSYDYLRSDESHMMKNTEWGAVAYLQHSSYGSRASVRVNNNTDKKTGYSSVIKPTCGQTSLSTSCNTFGTSSDVTKPYNTAIGYLASTTGNITGIYDMSGGSLEYVMGYNTAVKTVGGSSGITSLYSDFFTNSKWNQYYDQYTINSTSNTVYNKRILGDATGEMGPFALVKDSTGENPKGSWYDNMGYYFNSDISFIFRGGGVSHGTSAGIFFFNVGRGAIHSDRGFRVVLTPQ